MYKCLLKFQIGYSSPSILFHYVKKCIGRGEGEELPGHKRGFFGGLGLRRRLDSCKQFNNVALKDVLGVIYQKHLPVGHFCIFSTG